MTGNGVLIKTPEEAIETIKSNMPTSGYQMLREALNMAITALKGIQQYREIGTVGECREAMSRYRERGKLAKCKECLFLEERKLGKNGAISGICRIKPQNGRRYGTSSACRFFEKDYEESEEE